MTTPPFKTGSGDYLKVILLLWSLRYGWLVAIPLLAALVAGLTVDIRWLIVSLAMFFICIPMLLSMIYFYYMLTPEARRAVALKKVEMADGQYVRLDYLVPDDDTGDFKVTDSETIPWSSIKSINKFGKYLVIRLKAKRMTILLVPYKQ